MAKKKEWLSYRETLRRVEDFMVKSGIRRYCSEICHGQCCGGCYTSERACHKNEGRRLSCSTYVCGGLRISPGKEEWLLRQFRLAEHHITDQIHKAWIAVGRGNKSEWGRVSTPNSYFRVHTKEMMDAFSAKREFVMAGFNVKLAKEIRVYSDMVFTVAEIVMARSKAKRKEKTWGRRLPRFSIMVKEDGKYAIRDAAGEIFNI